MLDKENQNLKIKIYFRHIQLHKEASRIKPIEYSADILSKIKKN